jgi:hypothetical protein
MTEIRGQMAEDGKQRAEEKGQLSVISYWLLANG